MSGTKNRFEASLYRAGDADKKPLYTAKGGWNDRFTMHDVASGTDLETYDTNTEPAAPLNVAPIDEQDPWESRRAWRGVIDALNQGNMQATSDEKGKVEQGQRAMRKRQGLGETEWGAIFFKNVDGDEVFERLAEPIGAELGKEKTVGVWSLITTGQGWRESHIEGT